MCIINSIEFISFALSRVRPPMCPLTPLLFSLVLEPTNTGVESRLTSHGDDIVLFVKKSPVFSAGEEKSTDEAWCLPDAMNRTLWRHLVSISNIRLISGHRKMFVMLHQFVQVMYLNAYTHERIYSTRILIEWNQCIPPMWWNKVFSCVFNTASSVGKTSPLCAVDN